MDYLEEVDKNKTWRPEIEVIANVLKGICGSTPYEQSLSPLQWHDEQVAYTQLFWHAKNQANIRAKRRSDILLPKTKQVIHLITDQANGNILQVKIGEKEHEYYTDYAAALWLRKVDLDF